MTFQEKRGGSTGIPIYSTWYVQWWFRQIHFNIAVIQKEMQNDWRQEIIYVYVYMYVYIYTHTYICIYITLLEKGKCDF